MRRKREGKYLVVIRISDVFWYLWEGCLPLSQYPGIAREIGLAILG